MKPGFRPREALPKPHWHRLAIDNHDEPAVGRDPQRWRR
jgi:hypothetical protein